MAINYSAEKPLARLDLELPGLSSAEGRWIRLGPWYAMFPLEFAYEEIANNTAPGDAILDPFMGRGSTVVAAAALGRNAAGMEINPVAWVYAKTKINPAYKNKVLARLYDLAWLCEEKKLVRMQDFFHWAFDKEVLRFLLVAKDKLNWRYSQVDRTLMAIILVDLHGKESNSLSNQMRQTKAMAPDYSVNWWKARGMRPKEKDPISILEKKIEWRYRYGVPNFESKSNVLKGDSASMLYKVQKLAPFKLLLTSPPYYNVTNYNYDQWIRRWMLDGPPNPINSAGRWENRFHGMEDYRYLLKSVFSKAAKYMVRDSRIVVRTDARQFTFDTTLDVLKTVFPDKSVEIIDRPYKGKTQTALFGDKSEKPGEKDIIMC
ncbi:MAG: site-specific DNA-methyltransferase [Candidatus Thiodiazotropha sp. (ex Epidulcina cf. delphinae)]|nr:site-specific DNA-methyltransferase [Candidatus Thiodiazotropha sp. (ex Epidulcina cf. delphinae)]